MKRHYDSYVPMHMMTTTWGMPVTWVEDAEQLVEEISQEPELEASMAAVWRFMAVVGVGWLTAAALAALLIYAVGI